MKIVTVPNEILHLQAKPVEVIDGKVKKLVEEMTTTLLAQHNPEGVGLAAPQVGISIALFIMRPTKKSPVSVFVNPEIKQLTIDKTQLTKGKKSHLSNVKGQDEAKLEGCLSIPRIWGNVTRDKIIDVRYKNLDPDSIGASGAWVEKKFTGFEAIVIQHEVDHLNGILFTQRILDQHGKLYKEVNGELVKYEI